MAAADEVELICPHCGKDLSGLTTRGRSIHVGQCSIKDTKNKRALEAELSRLEEAHPSEPATKQRRVEQRDDEFSDGARTTAEFQCDKLKAEWLRFFLRGDVKGSMLEKVIDLANSGVPPEFSSARKFYSFVDSLPGPAFKRAELKVEQEEPAIMLYRSLTEVVVDLVHNFEGFLLDPAVVAPIDLQDFVCGDRYKELLGRFYKDVGKSAVLLPLVLSSGKKHLLAVIHILPFLFLLDETNLSKFHVGGINATSHPVYATIGQYSLNLLLFC